MDRGEVRHLFLQALEIDAAQRVAFLEAATLSPTVREEVLALLAQDSGAESFLRKSIARETPSLVAANQRFGPYELCELIGRGGMGAVYKANRVDGELQQVVAIKVIDRGWLDPRSIERFRQERQILSGLLHPNITRLLDGGTRLDGVPYLVMEYVEGLRLDHYCARQQLGIAERLRVFLPLCEAVEYAHQRLVVHRDLKPSNVLVTAAGQPKLLDFGVATALDADGSGRTQTTIVLTPDFASPEQVRGEQITTATDTYGLGAILYHLLTDHPPHPVKDLSPAELQKAICETGLKRASAYRTELRGDLENILSKALHPEPVRRYRSAGDMADDLVRFLERRPVKATPDRWTYRTRRFLARHWAASIAAALATLAIATGSATAIYQAHRAQRRFAQVRVLANRFLFDFEASIRDLPGTLPARHKMAATAREYLESLTGDAPNDPGLTRELAETHVRLARVENFAGESGAALQDLQKGLALLRSLHDDCCGTPAQRYLYIYTLLEEANTTTQARSVDSALPITTEALRLARDLLRTAPAEVAAERAMMRALTSHAWELYKSGSPAEARPLFAEAIDLGARLMSRDPADMDFAYQVARANFLLAALEQFQQNGAAARGPAETALQVLERMLAKHPENTIWRQLRSNATTTLADALRLMANGDPALEAQARETARRAYELAAADMRQNPGDWNLAALAVSISRNLADLLEQQGRQGEALALIPEATATIDQLLQHDPKNLHYRINKLEYGSLLGRLLTGVGREAEAASALAETQRFGDELARELPNDVMVNRDRLSVLRDQIVLERKMGRVDQARERCRAALELARTVLKENPAMERYLSNVSQLRQQARELGIPDSTLAPAARP
jgi:tetratricopeptide (TPR) repeat protein